VLREVDHRAKNTMAVVCSLLQLSPRDAPPAVFVGALESRIAAMARAHSLLARGCWAGADLRELVTEELASYADAVAKGRARIRISGPPVQLATDAVQPLSIVLHELATNAAKHGALSTPDGSLELTWAIEPEGGLRLAWTERGGPPVMAPPTRRGFGSKLIQAAARHQLSGKIELAWELEGLRCKLQVAACCIAAVGLAAPASTAADYAEVRLALAPAGSSLRRHRVLVVEDEALVAMETVAELEQLGAEVVGPAATLEEGLRLAKRRRSPLDAAVLDVNLGGQPVGPLADLLARRGVPILFATGYGEAPAGHHSAPVLAKPFLRSDLTKALLRLVRSPNSSRAG
jgi:two-component sensor histidine kinase/CheY-like chemotaxis protein